MAQIRFPISNRMPVGRLVAAFVVAAVVPLGVLAYSGSQVVTSALKREANARINVTAVASASFVREQMDSLRQLAESYATRPVLLDALGNGDPSQFDAEVIRQTLSQLEDARPGIATAFLTTADGTLVDVLPETPVIVGKNFASTDWFKGATTSQEPHLSEVFQSEAMGEPLVVAAASPVFITVDGRRVLAAVLVAGYDLSTTQAFADRLASTEEVDLTIADSSGRLVAAPGGAPTSVRELQDPRIRNALAGESGHTEGDGTLSAHVPVEGIDWAIVAEVPKDAALAEVNRVRNRMTSLIIVALILLAAMALALLRVLRGRERADEQLAHSEERTSSILEAARSGFVEMDEKGICRSWNAEAERIFGWTKHEAIGRSVAELIIPPELRDAHWAGLTRYLETGEGPVLNNIIEIEAVAKNGRRFPVELGIWAVHHDPAPPVFSAFVQDITERRAARDSLELAHEAALDSARMKSQFLANMSHEIRTPMNGIIGMTDLLLRTPLTPAQMEYAKTINGSADALLNIINDILDFSKIEAGKLSLEAAPFDVRETVDQVLELLGPQAASKHLELAALVQSDIPRAVVGDAGRFRQVLLNLVGNGIKFTEEGDVVVRGKVTSATDTTATLEFSVTDTGVGISPEDKARLFESFAQADTSTTRRYGGSGLGLTIAKQLVEMMGGTISMESEVGKGTSVTFALPFRIADPSTLPPPRPEMPLHGLRVLVVDDNEINRAVLSDMCKAWDFSVTTVPGGREALELLDESNGRDRFDLAVIDYHMPEMDGIELATRIREAGSALKMILLTSSGLSDEPQLARDAGMDCFVRKPIRQSALYDAIAEAFQASMTVDLSESAGGSTPRGESTLGRVLLADDNDVNRKVSEAMLRNIGYEVVSVADGQEAVNAWNQSQFDAVLMDCQMPVMDGFEATREIRRIEESNGSRTPIVAMTAGAMEGDAERCIEAGMDDYLAKPVKLQDLEATMRRWVAVRG